MVREINIHSTEDIEKLNRVAVEHGGEVGIHTEAVIIDAKSLLALLALDFSKKVVCVTEDDDTAFFKKIKELLV